MKRYLRPFYFLLALLTFNSSTINAQIDRAKLNYAGRDFWLTLHAVSTAHRFAFYISGKANATVSFTFTSNGTTQLYNYQAGSSMRILLTNAQITALGNLNPLTEVVHNYSMHISSDTDIVVQLVVIGGASDDGILLYPSEKQGYGDEFYLNGPPVIANVSATDPRHGSFSFVSRCDSTELEITPSADTRTHGAGIPFTVKLNRGEAYILNCGGAVRDLSGTRVQIKKTSCCNPINIFITYNVGYMSWPFQNQGGLNATCCADQLLEQILPVSNWDTLYPMVSYRNNPYSMIKIVSASNNNTVFFDGIPQFTLNAGGRYDTIIKGAVVVSSLLPISITQQMLSQTATMTGGTQSQVDSFSDPSAMWVLPIRDGIKEAYIRPVVNIPAALNVTPVYTMSAITLVSKAGNAGSILLNNQNISAQFSPFPNNPDYMYACIRLDTSLQYHLLSQERICAYYYGAYIQGSAAMPVGDLQASDFVVTPVISYTPDTIEGCVNGTVTLTADQADSYRWSDGSSQDHIVADKSGPYYVQMYHSDSCGKGGTKLFWVNLKDYAQAFKKDTLYKCISEPVILAADPADHYLWSDGSTAQQLQVAVFGDAYNVVETHQAICSQTQHAFAVLLPSSEIRPIELGADTAMCPGEGFVLMGSGENTIWSDGSRGNHFVVTEPGVYWATITDSCYEITYADTIVVRDSLCMKNFCNLVFPSAFSPDGNGRNDIFRPVFYGEFTGFYLSIYNRWGERVFQSYKKEEGWNGMYKGQPAEMGVYYYLCNYECTLKGNGTLKGEVTLIR